MRRLGTDSNNGVLFYRKEGKSAKSAKVASAPKSTKGAANSSKVAKFKEKAGSAFEFDEEEAAAPEAKKPNLKGKFLFLVCADL